MRRTVIAFALPFITALMLVQPVSATDATVITDAVGDTPVWCLGSDATPFTNLLNSNPPMVRVEYFDMIAYSLSLEGDHYRFWMKVLVDLPGVGYVFPDGLAAGEWLMWIDPGPYNPVYNPVVPLFTIGLRYDGSHSAFLYDYATGGRTPLEPESYGYCGSEPWTGSELWIEFPASVVEDYNTDDLWWAASTKAYLGSEGIGWRGVDSTDYDADLATWDIAWPEV